MQFERRFRDVGTTAAATVRALLGLGVVAGIVALNPQGTRAQALTTPPVLSALSLSPSAVDVSSGSSVVTVTATARPRTATVTIAGESVIVMQAGPAFTTVTLTSSPDVAVLAAGGGFQVQWTASGGTGNATIVSSSSWLAVRCGTAGTPDVLVANGCTTANGPGTYGRTVTATANTGVLPRTGTVTVTGLGGGDMVAVTVTQAAADATRIIGVSGNLAFGNVWAGTFASTVLTITNTGNSMLTVTNISYPSGFSGALSGAIPPGGSRNVTVTFTPGAAITYGGTVTVNADHSGGTNTIPASGTGNIPTASNGKLQIHYINVGQGDGAAVISPLGEVVLIDNGVLNQCDAPVRYLRAIGVTQVNYHIASHYHADHIGCTPEVLAAFPLVGPAYDRGGFYTSQTFDRYVTTVGGRRQTAVPGTTITLDAGSSFPVTIDIVAANGNGVSTTDENALSVVALLRFGDFEAEFGGDLTGSGPDIESGVAPLVGPVEVYKVHHHGSADGSNSTWTTTTRPAVGILSVGETNSYGHPTQAALDRLHTVGTKTVWTSRGNGAQPTPGLDAVGGNIHVEVMPAAPTFSVIYSGVAQVFPVTGTTPPPCVYSVTPTALDFPPSGGTGTLTVTTGSGCGWSVSIANPFFAASPMSGSGAGTTTLTVPPNSTHAIRDSAVSVGGTAVTVRQRGRVSGDLSGDGRADLIWQHVTTGLLAAWYMDGTRVLATPLLSISNAGDLNWRVVGAGDLDGDGAADLVWQHLTEGWLAAWLMRGATVVSTQLLSIDRNADLNWQIRGVGDLDGDGKADLIWQHTDGGLAAWSMDGTRVLRTRFLSISSVSDPNWRIAGAGDTNADGFADIVWQHQTDGSLAVWQMNDTQVTATRLLSIPQVTDAGWQIAAIGDTGGDGQADLIWQHSSTGGIAVWSLSGHTVTSTLWITTVSDLNWKVVGPG